MPDGGTIWTEKLIFEIDKSVRTIVARKYPKLSLPDREDIRQEIQFKIWKILENGKKIDRLESYLWKVVVTTALAVLEDRIKEISLDDVCNGPDNRLPEGLLTPAGTDAVENNEWLSSLLKTLPRKRRVVIKHHLEGMSLEEISAHLGWSLPKVRHLYYRSLKQLRKIEAARKRQPDDFRLRQENE